jgi:hypothetical protein
LKVWKTNMKINMRGKKKPHTLNHKQLDNTSHLGMEGSLRRFGRFPSSRLLGTRWRCMRRPKPMATIHTPNEM